MARRTSQRAGRGPGTGGPRPLGAGRGLSGAPRDLPGRLPDLRGQGVGLRAGPLHLLAYHGNWYLLALNAAKGRVESFALSRFRRIEGLGRTFDRPQDFDARAHARQAFGIAGGEKPMKIRLLFEPKLAVYISERQWHPSQTLKKRPDGRVELRMETTGRKELVTLGALLDARRARACTQEPAG